MIKHDTGSIHLVVYFTLMESNTIYSSVIDSVIDSSVSDSSIINLVLI